MQAEVGSRSTTITFMHTAYNNDVNGPFFHRGVRTTYSFSCA